MTRVVIDPGVLIAALLSDTGAPRLLIRAWIDGAFELVVCKKLLAELQRVLEREKFREYVSLQQVRAYVAFVQRFATVAADPELTPRVSSDPGDDYLLALAASESAAFLISGDAHLTRLKHSEPTVLTPRAFLTWLQNPRTS